MSAVRGRELAEGIKAELRNRCAGILDRVGRRPQLAAVAGDDPLSRRFVELKRTWFAAAGLDVRPYHLGPPARDEQVMELLGRLNNDDAVDAVFLQLPLPAALSPQLAADAIAPGKDVDAVGSTNLGRVLAGTAVHVPATSAAVLELLEDELGDLRGRTLVLVGTAGATERCIAVLWLARGGSACVLAPGDASLGDAAAGADAIVVMDELPPPDALRYVRNGGVLIDAGYAREPRPPGWLPPRALEHLRAYLPQYGNVGPLTVALLARATVAAASTAPR